LAELLRLPEKLTYESALAFLRSRGNEVQGIHLGLHRIQEVARALGNPHLAYVVLHLAGTNGKGSVAAMSEAILRRSGRRTGLYTSPHLINVKERIQVDGRPVSSRSFASLVSRIRTVEARLVRNRRIERPLTYFEFVTACAFLCFVEKKVDVAVVEVGLGGLLDATNIVFPQACVITGISYDHQEFLGDTLAQIAGEKAGIIKPGIPVISGCQARDARRVILGKAQSEGAPVLEIDRDCALEITEFRKGRCTIDFATPCRKLREIRLSLAGKHQARNAAMAIAAIDVLAPGIPAQDIRFALGNTFWPGRLDEYHADRRTLLEGAHNAEGAALLRDFLAEQNESRYELVFGAVRDKDIRAMSRFLFPAAQRIHLTPLNNPRSTPAEKIASVAGRFREKMEIHANAQEALRAAWNSCRPGGLVVVTGSLYLVGELLPIVRAASNRSGARCHSRGFCLDP
jgi:dihydrofolate synthase/folylpolyglutamate synthase